MYSGGEEMTVYSGEPWQKTGGVAHPWSKKTVIAIIHWQFIWSAD